MNNFNPIRRASSPYQDPVFYKVNLHDDVALMVLALIIVFRIPMIFAIQIFALTIPHQFSAKRTPRTIIHRGHGCFPSFQFPIFSAPKPLSSISDPVWSSLVIKFRTSLCFFYLNQKECEFSDVPKADFLFQ